MAFILVFFFFKRKSLWTRKRQGKIGTFLDKRERQNRLLGGGTRLRLWWTASISSDSASAKRGESPSPEKIKSVSQSSHPHVTRTPAKIDAKIFHSSKSLGVHLLFSPLYVDTRRAVDWVCRSTRCPSRVRVKPNRKWNANHLLCTIPVCVCVSVHCQTFFGGDHGGDPWTGFLRINKLPTSVDTFPNFSRVYMQRWKTWERGSFR